MTYRMFATRTTGRRASTLLVLAGLLAPLPGCQSITGTASVSQVRLVDAASDVNGVDVYQGSGILAYNLGLGTVTSYVPITPGNYSIIADNAGTRQLLAAQGGTFANGSQYTVLLGNYLTGLQETILKDQSQAAPSGQIAIRVVDESDTSGGLDLYLIPSGATILTVKPFLTNVTFTQNSGYINIPAGTYTLEALPTGTTQYTGAAVTYGGGSAKTLIILNQQLITIPGVQVITASDYDPIAATM